MYINIPYNQITPKNQRYSNNTTKNSGLLGSAFNQTSPAQELPRMRESPEYDEEEFEEGSGDRSETSDRCANELSNRKTMSFYNKFQKQNEAKKNQKSS